MDTEYPLGLGSKGGARREDLHDPKSLQERNHRADFLLTQIACGALTDRECALIMAGQLPYTFPWQNRGSEVSADTNSSE